MKDLIKLTLLILAVWFGWNQYKFDAQIEHYSQVEALESRCDYWDLTVPALREARYASKKINKIEYDRWEESTKKKRIEACDDSYRFNSFHREMPYTEDWEKDQNKTGLNSISGYLKDLLFREDFKVQGPMFNLELKPTVLVKNHFYSAFTATCVVNDSEMIKNSPLPLLKRRLYLLLCTDPKSISEGIGGFIVVTTSDNMESM